MKTYCTACGFKIDYQSNQKPNFCPKCGFSFKGQSTASDEQNEDTEFGSEPPEETLALSEGFELDFEILERPKAPNKLSDLAGTSSGAVNQGGASTKKGRGRPKKVDKEQVWQDFKREAGGTPHREQQNEE